MERARETGVRFNPDKCRMLAPSCHSVVTASGLQADPRKIEAIHSIDPSTSLADLQTFLGMVQFLSRLIPNLAYVSAILWDLTKSKNEFQWHPEHQAAVNSIKQMIASSTSLQYFDGSKPVTVQVDASTRGLGANLLHENGPVEYRSKLLTETEQRYPTLRERDTGCCLWIRKISILYIWSTCSQRNRS